MPQSGPSPPPPASATGPTRWVAGMLLALLAAAAFALVAWMAFTDSPGVGRSLHSVRRMFDGEWRFPTHTVVGIATAALMWFTAMGIGQWILYKFEATTRLPSLWARWTLAALTGWIPMSLATLVLGLGGLTDRVALAAGLLAATGFAVRGWSILWWDLKAMEYDPSGAGRGRIPQPDENRSAFPVPPRSEIDFMLPAWIVLPILAVYAIAIPYAATAATESDELRYHLAAPAAWILSGRIHYLPHQAFSNFPFLIESLYLTAMSLQGSEAARLIHLSFLESSATLVGLLAFLAMRGSARTMGAGERGRARNAAALAGLAFACVPVATIVACWGFNDLALTAYFLATVYLGALWLIQREPPPAWLAGAMAGGAFSTKYSMLPLLGAAFVFLIFCRATLGLRRRGGFGEDLKYAGVAVLVACAVASPWYLKNYRWTHNPFYPLAYGVFDGADWSPANAKFYAAKAAEKGYSARMMYEEFARAGHHVGWLLEPPGKIAAALATPLTTTFRYGAFEGHFLGPVPLIAMLGALAGAALLGGRRISARIARGKNIRPGRADSGRTALALWFGGLIVGSWAFWFLTYQSNRLLLPTLGIVIAAGAWGLAALTEATRARVAKQIAALAALAAIGFSLLWTWSRLAGSDRFEGAYATAFGFKTRRDYLDERVAYHSSARALETLLGEESRALLIGEHRTLYFPAGVVASDWFDTPQPLPWIERTRDNAQLLDALLAEKIRFILLNKGELSKYIRPYFQPRFRPEQYLRFEALTGFDSGKPDPRLKPIYENAAADIRIYEIQPATAAETH